MNSHFTVTKGFEFASVALSKKLFSQRIVGSKGDRLLILLHSFLGLEYAA